MTLSGVRRLPAATGDALDAAVALFVDMCRAADWRSAAEVDGQYEGAQTYANGETAFPLVSGRVVIARIDFRLGNIHIMRVD